MANAYDALLGFLTGLAGGIQAQEQPDPDFSLDKYRNVIQTEFQALGMQVSIKEKKKAKDTHVDSAFLKSETIWRELVLEGIIPQSGLG